MERGQVYRTIFLNTWNGIRFEELISFVEREKENTDVFCFQEVLDTSTARTETHGSRANLYLEITRHLEGFSSVFAPMFYGYDLEGKVDFPLWFGNVTFWRKELCLEEASIKYIHREDWSDVGQESNFFDFPRNVLLTRFQMNERLVTIGNCHGVWTPEGKGDNPDRIKQADKLGEIRDGIVGEFILGGDFNLDISNPSLETIGQGMRNLIIENGITSTRSSFYPGSGLYADYVWVSRGVVIKKFRVLKDNVSDHLPMEIIFSV